jgi:phage terminase small subunit
MAPLKKTQHEKFAQLWFAGATFEQAAIDAGYKPKWARSIGSRLSTNVNILARYNELQQAAADAKIMSVRERKERLSEIGRARVTDFVGCEKGIARINVDLQSANSAAIQEVVTDEVQIGKGNSALMVQVTKLKLRDPVRAIEELNKMDGAYAPSRTEVTGKDGKPIQLETKPDLALLSDEELSTLENILSKTTNARRSSGGESPPSPD